MAKQDKAIYNPVYRELIVSLTQYRKVKGITQEQLSQRTGIPRYDVSKTENFVRELGIIEIDKWLEGLGLEGDVMNHIKNKMII